jgi:uncharacterized protein with beta-barrel porin domain
MFDQPASTETVGGALRCARRMAASVGARLATPGRRGAFQFAVGQGGLATFSGGIGWRRGFGEAPAAHPGFNGGSPFVIAATPAAVNALALKTGLDFDLADRFGQSHVLRVPLADSSRASPPARRSLP